MRRLLPLLLLLPLAGCSASASVSTGGVDETKIEKKLLASIEETTGQQVKGVKCPGDIKEEKGEAFECTITGKDGTTVTAKGTIDTDKGRFSASAPVINTAKLEQVVGQGVTEQVGARVTLDCPDLVALETGAKSTCKATRGDLTRDVVITQKDDTGNVRYRLGDVQ